MAKDPLPAKPKKRFRILSLDGGGIRGLITAVWLDRLERELGSSLRDHFELIAGTSTGSILACGIAAGLPAADIVKMYQERGREVFPSTGSRLWSRITRTFAEGVSAPKYSDAGLQEVLKGVFGDLRMSDIPERLLLMVTSYNVLIRQPVVFKNRKTDHRSIPLWEVAKASSSAPTYFPAHIMRLEGADAPLIDGGVVANNPTACAIAEANACQSGGEEPCTLEHFIVASFGTGESTRPIEISQALKWGAIEWAIPVIDVLFDGASDATDYVARQLIPDNQYFRFQTRLEAAYDDMDRADAMNLNALVSMANQHLSNEGGNAKLKNLAALLK